MRNISYCTLETYVEASKVTFKAFTPYRDRRFTYPVQSSRAEQCNERSLQLVASANRPYFEDPLLH